MKRIRKLPGETGNYLGQVAKFSKENKMVFSPELFLATNPYGQYWETPGKLPKGVKRQKLGTCYMSSYHLAASDPDRFIYIEGFATAVIPTSHAWCLDKKTNEIVDPVWIKGYSYYGIPIRQGFLEHSMVETEYYGLFPFCCKNEPPIFYSKPEEYVHPDFLKHAA